MTTQFSIKLRGFVRILDIIDPSDGQKYQGLQAQGGVAHEDVLAVVFPRLVESVHAVLKNNEYAIFSPGSTSRRSWQTKSFTRQPTPDTQAERAKLHSIDAYFFLFLPGYTKIGFGVVSF